MIFINQYRFPVVSSGGGTLLTYGTPNSGFVQSPTGTYTGLGHAVSPTQLAVNQNMLYDQEYAGTSNRITVVGISDTTTNTIYDSYSLGMFVLDSSGTYYRSVLGALTDLLVTAVVGDRFGIKVTNRAVSAYYAVGYTRAGVWNELYHHTAIDGVNVAINLKADIVGASGVLTNPKILIL